MVDLEGLEHVLLLQVAASKASQNSLNIFFKKVHEDCI
jgi:hypothetical protein